MISADTPLPFVLYHTESCFRIGGGGRPKDKKVLNGDTWVISDTIKKGDVFSCMKKEFTLIDYQVILKPEFYNGPYYPSITYFK